MTFLDIASLLFVPAAVPLILVALRANRAMRGYELPETGWMNKVARKWAGYATKNQAEAALHMQAAKQAWADARQQLRSDRAKAKTAAEVPARAPSAASTVPPQEDGAMAEKGRLPVQKDPSLLGRWKGAIDAWFERQQVKLDQKRAAEARRREIEAESAAWAAKGADGRLQDQYSAYLEGKITLEEYRDAIIDERDMAKEALADLRASRRDMDPDDYQMEREIIDDDLDATRWRLGWVDQQIAAKKG